MRFGIPIFGARVAGGCDWIYRVVHRVVVVGLWEVCALGVGDSVA